MRPLQEKPGRVPTLPVPNDRVKGAGPVPGPAPPFLAEAHRFRDFPFHGQEIEAL